MIRYLFVVSFLIGSMNLYAQVPDVEIEIVNPLKVTLPKAERNFSKVPALPSEPITPAIAYDYSLVSFSAPSFSPAVRPLKIKPPQVAAASPNFVSVGFGNFSSPYLKGYLSFFPLKSNTVGGLSVHHHSFGKGPINEKFSSSGFTSVTANLKASNNTLTTEALVGFENRSVNFYGYETPVSDKDSIRQAYNIFFASGNISNTKKSDFDFSLKPSFSYLQDKYEAKESDLSLALNARYRMKGKNSLLLHGAYSLISRKDSAIEATPRHLLKIAPQYQFSPIDNLLVKVGVNVVFESDSISKKDVHFYPLASANFSLGKSFSAFASLSGDMEKVSLHTLSAENPWVNKRIQIAHSNKALDFSGGINGDLGAGFSFAAGFTFTRFKSLYVFLNDSLNQVKFNAIYDDVVRTNFFAGINFDKGNYSIRLKGDYFTYSTDILEAAWHRPTYKLDAYVVIKAADKLSIVPRIYMLGGMKAYDFTDDKEIALDPAIDLNVSAEYYFTNKIGAFVKLSNILNREYQLFNQYPVRGFQGLAGITWKF
jgi:hypothetical protein